MSQSLVLSDSTTGRGQLQETSRELLYSEAWGIADDRESTPDPDVLAYGVAYGFEELTALVPEIEQIPEEARFSCPHE